MAVNKSKAEIPTIDVNLVTIATNVNEVVTEIGFATASKLKVEVQSEEEKAVKLVVKGVLRAQKPATTTITGNQITLTDNVFNPELVVLLQGGTISYNNILTSSITIATPAAAYYMTLEAGKYVTFTTLAALASGDKVVFDDSASTVTVTKSGVDSTIVGTIATVITGSLLSSVKTTGTKVTGYAPPVSGSSTKGSVFTLNAYSAQYDGSGQIVQYEKISYPNCTGVPVSFSSEDGAFRAPEYTIDSAPKTGESPYQINYVSSLPTLV